MDTDFFHQHKTSYQAGLTIEVSTSLALILMGVA